MRECKDFNTLLEATEYAERNGLWLRSHYQAIVQTPAELRAANAEGRFRWGPVNWEFIHPHEVVGIAEGKATAARDAADQLWAKAKETMG